MYFTQLQSLVPALPNQVTTPPLNLPTQAMPQGIIPAIPMPIPQDASTQQETQDDQLSSDQGTAQQDLITQSDQDDAQTSANTVDLPDKEIGVQGNWMKKKEWLKKAYELYDQIQKLGIDIQSSRSIFNQKFNNIDDELDQFYKNYGIQQGKLDEVFASVTKFIEKKKQQELAALASERQQDKILERDYKTRIEEVEALMKNHKAQLDQLRFNMKSIEELDQSISERMKRLDEQIDNALQLINQGNTTINAMWYIIDDTIARTRYYELINNVQAPLQAIHAYLTIDLQQDFDQVIGTIRQCIAKVLDETRQLESVGFVLKNRAPRLEEIRAQVKLEREKALLAQQEAEKKRQEELELKKRAKKEIPHPWWKRTLSLISTIFSNLYAMLVGTDAPAPQNNKVNTAQ